MSDKFNSKSRSTKIGEWTKNPDGSLTIPVVIISEEVLDYPEFGTQEYVSDDIYKPEFLEQINGLPFVLEHPVKDGAPVDVKSDNYQQYIKGTCFNPEAQPDKNRTIAMCRVYDKDTVEAIESGDIKELSAKYESADVQEEGTFNGKSYNVRQTNMVLNHLALTEAGRAGDKVKVLISKQNSKGDNMEEEKKPDESEKTNQEMETSELTLEALNQKIEGLTEVVQGLVDKLPGEEKVNEEETEEEEKKGEDMVEMIKQNSLSVKDMESFVKERDEMIADAKELIGSDVHMVVSKFNSLDEVRRYALVKSGRYNADSIKSLSAEGARVALHEAAWSQKKLNSQKTNSTPMYEESDVDFFRDVKELRA